MTPPSSECSLALAVLVACAVGVALGRVCSSEYLYEPSVHRPDGSDIPRPKWAAKTPAGQPTFGSNDRSRWATIRALVDEGTFVIGKRVKWDDKGTDAGIVFEDGFGTVDKVLHPERLEYYSTKPPLLTLLAAAEYAALKKTLGWRMAEDRWLVVRAVLIAFNLLPFALYLLLMAGLVRRFSSEAFTLYYIAAAAAFAGMAWPFLVTFNNHVPATVAAALAVWCAVRIALEDDAPRWLWAVGGLASGFAFSCELPALSLLGALLLFLALKSAGRAMALFLPLALLAPAAQTVADYVQLGQVTPTYAQFGTEWYEYPGSHWLPEGKTGIDYARRNGETRAVYAFHLTLGHHGWFSLMPVWLLALPGIGLGLRRLNDGDRVRRTWAMASLLCLLVSIAVIGFYLYKSDNYGGWCNGPRWLMWLSPLWLVAMIPVLDRLGKSRWGVALALVLLVASMMSMSYQSWNPWRHPWIYNAMEASGWPGY
ncbi:MAG: hypothetical protein K2W96_09580 [Gemmataceae bacterium]|nr:hypothetical protein [Gemmataceae bacterium]